MIRIIGGTLRGRLLKTPKGDSTRPTLAILRKAVFDICQGQIEGSLFLDLFAGSGSMGIEALSRGAHHVTFVEKERAAITCIQSNLSQFNLHSQSLILPLPALAALQKLLKKGASFDLIYIDPPYGSSTSCLLLEFFDTNPFLKPGGTLFFEDSSRTPLPEHSYHNLRLKRTRTFSQSTLYEFQMPQQICNKLVTTTPPTME